MSNLVQLVKIWILYKAGHTIIHNPDHSHQQDTHKQDKQTSSSISEAKQPLATMKLLLLFLTLSAFVAVALSFRFPSLLKCDLNKLDKKMYSMSKQPPPSNVEDIAAICHKQKSKLRLARLLIGTCIKNKKVLAKIKKGITEASSADCDNPKVNGEALKGLECAAKLSKIPGTEVAANKFVAGVEYSATLPKEKQMNGFCATLLTHLATMKVFEDQACPNHTQFDINKVLVKLCKGLTLQQELAILGSDAKGLTDLLAKEQSLRTQYLTALPTIIKVVNSH